jgi:hypothetical protein
MRQIDTCARFFVRWQSVRWQKAGMGKLFDVVGIFSFFSFILLIEVIIHAKYIKFYFARIALLKIKILKETISNFQVIFH